MAQKIREICFSLQAKATKKGSERVREEERERKGKENNNEKVNNFQWRFVS